MSLSYPNPLAVFETCAKKYGLTFDYTVRVDDFKLVLTFSDGNNSYHYAVDDVILNEWKRMDAMTLLFVAEPMVEKAKEEINNEGRR